MMLLEALMGSGPRAAVHQVLGKQGAGVWFGAGSSSLSGVPVTEDTAMTCGAAFACTRVLAGMSAMLPWKVFKEREDGGREQVRGHTVYSLLNVSPNPHLTDAMTFRCMMMDHKVNWGNAYAEIERDGAGNVVALWPIHPSRVVATRTADGVFYRVVSETPVMLPAVDMYHVMSVINDGLKGRGVLDVARESLGMSIATERYAASFFANAAMPLTVLKHPKTLPKQARDNIREEWVETYGGSRNSGKPAVLWEGMELQALSLSPENAQFVQNRAFNTKEIARWYDVPPHLIGDLDKATFSNIEHQSLEFIQNRMMPHISAFESQADLKLLTRAERASGFYTKIITDAVLRGDVASRTEALLKQLMNGALTLNEWRAMEDRNPIEGDGGDKHFVPANLTVLDKAISAAETEPTLLPKPEPAKVVPAPEDEEDDEAEEPEEDARLVVSREKATACVRDAMAHMIRVETNAMERAAGKPGKFLSAVDEFYGAHEAKLAERLEPLVGLVNALYGAELSAAELAKQHCEQSKAAMLAAAEVPADSLVESVGKATAGWVTRPSAFDPDQPRDEKGQFAETDGGGGGDEESASAAEERRAQEDSDLEDARAAEDDATEKADEAAKAASDERREAEDEEMETRHSEEDDYLEGRHGDERAEVEKERITELDAAADHKESRSREDGERQTKHNSEDSELEARQDAEYKAQRERHWSEESEQDSKSSDADQALEDAEESGDAAAIDAAKAGQKEAERASKDLQKRHDDEDLAMTRRHGKEQRELDRQHEKEDKAAQKAREKQDEATVQAVDEVVDKKLDELKGRQKQEERDQAARHKQEKADLKQARKDEDAKIKADRKARDAQVAERRKAEDRDIEHRRQSEDDAKKGAA